MASDKDQSLDVTLRPPQPGVAVRPGLGPETTFDSAFGAPAMARGMLPPSDGVPSAARAVELLGDMAETPDVMARAQMSVALQRTVGNARMTTLLQTVPTQTVPPPASPTAPARVEAPPQPAAPQPAAVQPTAPALVPQPAPAVMQPAAAIPTPATPAAVTPAPVTPMPVAPATTARPKAAQPAVQKPAAEAGAPEAEAPAEATQAAPAAKAAAEPAAAKGTAAPAAKTEGAPAAKSAAPEAAEGGAGGAGGAQVKLKMPEAPREFTPGTRKRIGRVKSAAGKAEAANVDMPEARDLAAEAQGAVTQPKEEADALAEQARVKEMVARTPPSAKIEQLCRTIYDIIYNLRPKDEDELTSAEPEKMAQKAGQAMSGSVEGEVKTVERSYDPLKQMPDGRQQPQKDPPQAPPESVPVPAVNAQQATPDAVPPENVSLDADVADNRTRAEEAGVYKEPAKLAQTGPHVEAREQIGELEETARTDPAQVLAEQQAALAKADGDLLALQQQALTLMSGTRRKTVSGASTQQKGMVRSEEETRALVSKQAQEIVKGAQDKVNGLLKDLPRTTMAVWNARVNKASGEFNQELAHVEQRIRKRHSGWFGWARAGLDYVSGLPGWVKASYDKAEKKFGDDICALARELSSSVNFIVGECELAIGKAEADVAALFKRHEKQLGSWVVAEQAKFTSQLGALRKRAYDTRDNFEKDLVQRATQVVEDVHVRVEALREKAKGLIGRIADAIGRFLDDPIKFIIEALLDLLSIPRAAFWAVVAKIRKVIGDIADDPEKFANNLMAAVGKGFEQFFDHIGDHLIAGFIDWLTGGLAAAGVELPRDFTLKSLITFFLQLMGITWPRIRKLLAKHVGEENVALLEKAYSLVANLIALGPEGIFEMLKERLNPQEILDQIIKAAVDYMMQAVVKAVSARVLLLFNPVGAILQAIEAIYRVLKWVFTNAARIFKLIETIVDGIADIIAGNIGGMANAIEKALAGLIPPVIDFLAEYLGFGDLPDKVRDTILGFQAWVEGILDSVIGWLVEKGKALLAAVGLGGEQEAEEKEDKEKKAAGDIEVGKTVTFTAGGERHKLWIQTGAAGAEVWMSSTDPGPLAPKLDEAAEQSADFKPELKAEVAEAKQQLGLTTQHAQEAKQLKDQVKGTPENADAGAEFQKKDEQTESDEEKLAAEVQPVIDAVGAPQIYKLVGETLVQRGKPDALIGAEVKGVKLPPPGYSMPLKVKTGRIHIQRVPKGDEYPEVHLDKEGKLQKGPGRAFSATDEEKFEVYNQLLDAAGLSPLKDDVEDVDDVDQYRRDARVAIIDEIKGNKRKLLSFMKKSKKAIPDAYNRLRGDIVDACVSMNPKFNYSRPGPEFLKATYPALTAVKSRQPDGVSGNELYESKGYLGRGPGRRDVEQYEDNIRIVAGRYLSSKDEGPYVVVNYIVRDPDAYEEWAELLTADEVELLA